MHPHVTNWNIYHIKFQTSLIPFNMEPTDFTRESLKRKLTHFTYADSVATRRPWATSLTWDTLPINKNICGKLWVWLDLYFHYFFIISIWNRTGPFIWSSMNSLQPQMLWDKFGWNWPSSSGVENFQILSNECIFSNWLLYSLGKGQGPSIE